LARMLSFIPIKDFSTRQNHMRTSSKNSRFKEAIPRRGNCHDNACIESFFSHLQTEKLYLVRPKRIEQAYQAIQEYIHFYNHSRFQEKCNGLSPIEYREKTAAYYTLFFIVYLTGLCARNVT
jgi:Integrase core domain